MLVLTCLLIALLLTRLTGGRLSRLAELHWRAWWLLPVALGLQVLIVEVHELPVRLSQAVHVLTYLLAAGFLWANRRMRPLWVVAAGAACNGFVIALNGGTLPASRWALAQVGITDRSGFTNSGVVARPVLGWLGDNWVIPGPFPLGNVFSLGDVLIVAGAVWLLWAGTRSTPALGAAEARSPQPQAPAMSSPSSA